MSVVNYAPGDPILIRNIITHLKSQGVFDQFRKECISDVDTKTYVWIGSLQFCYNNSSYILHSYASTVSCFINVSNLQPAYQNLCHRVDGQVSSYLSDIRWVPDLNKNQLRENIRKYVNECSFVESGINRIVDQLVNPRINTILVPKVEDIVYKFIGIRRPDEDTTNENKEPKNDVSNKERVDTVGNQSEWSNNKSDSHSSSDKYKSTDSRIKDENLADEDDVPGITIKDEEEFKKSPENFASEQHHTEDNSLELKSNREFDHDEKQDDSRTYSNIESDEENMDDDDDLSPPFEVHSKSDVDAPAINVESDYLPEVSEAKEESEQKTDTSETNANDNIERTDEGSIDSTGNISYPEAEKNCEATPSLDIPKTPTINYETSEDSDDTNCVKTDDGATSVDPALAENRTTCDVPDFDKIAQKIAEDNREEAKRGNEESEGTAIAGDHKSHEGEVDKSREKTERTSSSSDKRRKDSEKSCSSRSNDSSRDSRDKKHSDRKKEKDRHRSSKHESSRSDKDRKSDREHSGHERHKSSKDRDKNRKNEVGTDHEKNKENGAERRSSKHHDEKRSKDDRKKESSSKSEKYSRHESKDDKRRNSSNVKHQESDKETKNKKVDGVDVKKQPKNQCAGEKLKSDRRSSDRDSSGPAPTSNSGHSSHRSSSKSEREKHEKYSDKSKHSSSHKSKKNNFNKHHRDSKSDKSASSDNKKSNNVKNGLSSGKGRTNVEHHQLEKMLESIHGANEKNRKTPVKTNVESLKRRFKETAHEELVDVLNGKLQENIELRKPKIARNESEFGKVVRLRKEYKERMKLLQQQGKENATIADGSALDLLSIPDPGEFEAGLKEKKNSVKIDSILASPFKEFYVNLSRVDECLHIVNGRYITTDKTVNDRNNNDDGSSMVKNGRNVETTTKISNSDDELEAFEAEVSNEKMRRVDIEEIIGCRAKNTHITYRADLDNVNIARFTENKENMDGMSIQKTNCKNTTTDDDFHYFEVNDTGYREEFRKFVEATALAFESNQCLRNFSIELQYPKRYDDIFRTQLGAKVQRCDVRTNNCDKSSSVSLNYNSEIIDPKGEEKGIMMRIKMCPKSKSEDLNDTPIKKRKKIEYGEEANLQISSSSITIAVADESGSLNSSSCNSNSSHPPSVVTVKRKTLGIKRRISNGKTKMALNGHINTLNKTSNTHNLSTEDDRNGANKLEDTSGDCCLNQIESLNSVHNSVEENSSQPMDEAKMDEKKKENISSHNSVATNSNAALIKTPKNQRRNSLIKNTGDQTSKDAAPKRTPSQTKCYYDNSDLYKPRPSFLLTTRRCRGLNSENK